MLCCVDVTALSWRAKELHFSVKHFDHMRTLKVYTQTVHTLLRWQAAQQLHRTGEVCMVTVSERSRP